MNKDFGCLGAILVASAGLLVLGACHKQTDTQHHDHPAQVDPIDEHLALVTLTETAAQRIGLEYGEVSQAKKKGR